MFSAQLKREAWSFRRENGWVLGSNWPPVLPCPSISRAVLPPNNPISLTVPFLPTSLEIVHHESHTPTIKHNRG